MNQGAEKKVKYILLRYKLESKNLSIDLRLELLKRWTKSCVDNEEYEMAFALRRKRNELIRSLRVAKSGSRYLHQELFIMLKWLFRKIKRKIFR